jgi:hypothetical protein
MSGMVKKNDRKHFDAVKSKGQGLGQGETPGKLLGRGGGGRSGYIL